MSTNYIQLNTGAHMPLIGLGTWKSRRDSVGLAVEYSLTEAGYRHIDCAAIYGNEKEIGEAFNNVFKNGKVGREDVFITSKLWNTQHEPNRVLSACKQTLSDLQLDYLDLYLMHWGVAVPHNLGSEPVDDNGLIISAPVSIQQTWQAMEELVGEGLVRAIGVANFTTMMLYDLLSYARIKPAVNQIELHPYNQQKGLISFCQSKNVAVTAYSPLGSPGNHPNEKHLLDDIVFQEFAQKYHKTPAQIALRWGMQRNTIIIPKSTHPERIKENISVFDFELSSQEIETISKLDKRHRYVDPSEWWGIPYFE